MPASSVCPPFTAVLRKIEGEDGFEVFGTLQYLRRGTELLADDCFERLLSRGSNSRPFDFAGQSTRPASSSRITLHQASATEKVLCSSELVRLGPAEMYAIRLLSGNKQTDLKHAATLSRFISTRNGQSPSSSVPAYSPPGRTSATPDLRECNQVGPLRLRVRFAIVSMTVLPKPRRSGCRTGGPFRSIQLIAKISPSSHQRTSTRPASVESAANFAGIGGKLVEREPDGLRGNRRQTQLGAAHP
jgi:hypothetical protein